MLLVSSQTAEDHLEWCGLVESKVRYLVGNLERNQHIKLAHVNPKCFERGKQPATTQNNGSVADANDRLITAAFCSMWFIGMEFNKMENLNVDLTENIQNFTNQVHKHATTINLQKEGMEIEARHVRRKQLITYLDKEILNRERKSMDANASTATTPSAPTTPTTATPTAAMIAGSRKRKSSETMPNTNTSTQNESPQTTKRQRTNEYVSIQSARLSPFVHSFKEWLINNFYKLALRFEIVSSLTKSKVRPLTQQQRLNRILTIIAIKIIAATRITRQWAW